MRMNNKSAFLLFHILMILIIIIGLPAQEQQFHLNAVRVEGNLTTDTTLVVLNSGLKPGHTFTAADVSRAVKNLWALKLFSDIKILVENQTPSGVDLIIRLEEFPRLAGWVVKGNDKINKKEIDKETGFYRGIVYTPFRAYKAKKAIINKYKEKGYLLAKVSIDTVSTTGHQIIAEIKIDEGEKVQVKRIRVFGNGKIPNDELKNAFDEIKEDRWWRGADFNQKKYEKDLENILTFCHNQGYREAEIVRDSIYYGPEKQDMFIDVYVNEGRQYFFGKITFEGNTVFPDNQLRSLLLFQEDDVYNQENFEKSIRENLQNLYYNHGYLFTNIQPVERPVSRDTIDVTLKINEGEVVQIKEILITGNTKTNEKVIRRNINIYPGDVFNREKLERSVREVWMTNYFANIIPDVKMIPNDNRHVNLEIEVEEKSTDTANMSAGYSQTDGLIGSLGFTFNNFSLVHPLSGGDGQRLSLQYDFGKYYRNLSFSFTEPWVFGRPILAGFSLFSSRNSSTYLSYDVEQIGGSVRVGKRFRWPDNYFRGDWSFRVSNNRMFNIDDDYLEYLNNYYPNYNFETYQISLTQVISRDTRNRPEFPTSGSNLSFSTKLAGGPLQGDEDFVKNIFAFDSYVPMKFGTVLLLSNKVGVISGLKGDYYANANELFYMGGSGLGYAEALRGYEDGSVGPQSSSGSAVGGRSLARFSAELRFPIAPNPTIYGLFFMETGNVWENFSNMNLYDLKRSVGAGVRLFMPMIGMIGVDVGYGFDHVDENGIREGKWKLHFKFGQF